MEIEFGKTKFSRWLVLGQDANPKYWFCRCDCGTERRVGKRNLKSGSTRSCGCWDQERKTTHGMSRTKTYQAWQCMKDRVRVNLQYINNKITICNRWTVFENFLADMGVCPPDKYSVDRIDNNKGYRPGNCRWANRSEQQRNKSTTRMLTFDGRTQAASAWAEEKGMSLSTITGRLDRGWSIERTLTTPEGMRRGRGTPQTKDQLIEFQGRTQTLEQWAREFDLNVSTMIERVWSKWSMERIAATPQGRRGGYKKAAERRRLGQAIP